MGVWQGLPSLWSLFVESSTLRFSKAHWLWGHTSCSEFQQEAHRLQSLAPSLLNVAFTDHLGSCFLTEMRATELTSP